MEEYMRERTFNYWLGVMCMVCVFMIGMLFPVKVHAEIASGTSGTCSWVINDEGVLTISEGTLGSYSNTENGPWYDYRSRVTKVVAEPGVKAGAECARLFYNFGSCTEMDLTNLDTSGTTNMNLMFYGCGSLTSLNLSGFDTSNVTNMHGVFVGCSGLTSLDVSHLNTSNVTNMARMFENCSSLTDLDVSGFDTSKVTDMSDMFRFDDKLTNLNISGFDTSKVTKMYNMFDSCKGLTSLDVSGFDTSNVTSMKFMFVDCSGLTSLDISGFNTSNVTYMNGMFYNCSGLTSLDVSGLDTSNVTNTSNMFDTCKGLTSLNVSGFDTSNVTDMDGMFRGCSGLTDLDLSGFDTSNVTNMGNMFRDCSGLSSLDLSSLDTSNVTNMNSVFESCSGLTSLDVSGFDTSNVTTMYRMFYDCSSLTNLDVSGFDTSKVTSMGSMFMDCSGLAVLDLSGFDTSNVTSMSSMFYGCSALTTLDVSGFDTSNVTSMGSMFCYCSALTSLDVSGFDTSNVTSTGSMFHNCSALTTLDVSGFDTSKVTSMSSMFNSCSKLANLDVSGFDTTSVTDMSYMFRGCSKLTSLDLSHFNTKKSTNMKDMFTDCTSLASVNLGADFKFDGKGGIANKARLPIPESMYSTRMWIKRDGAYGPYTASQLQNSYTSDMAGEWIWEIKSTAAVLHYDANGGYSSIPDKQASTAYQASLAVVMPGTDKVYNPHYSLSGWNTAADGTGTHYDAGGSYTNVMEVGNYKTLYAQWSPLTTRTYKVKYYQQSTSLDRYLLVETEQLSGDYGTVVTPPTKTYPGFLSPTVITATIAEDDSLIIDYYYDRSTYTISFKGNGADSGSMEDQLMLCNYGVTLRPLSFGKTANMFTGWNTEPDGTGTAYANQQALALDVPDGTTITLYAQWIDNSDSATDPTTGVFFLTAKPGQTIVIPDLPAGTTYTIEEMEQPSGWDYKYGKRINGSIAKNQIANAQIANKYVAAGQIDIVAHKRMEGRDPLPGEFAFQLMLNDTVIGSKTNEDLDMDPYIYIDPVEEDGEQVMVENPWYRTAPVLFDTIYYTQSDIGKTYTYTIREVTGQDPTVQYDSHIESVTVTIADAGGGLLDIQADYDIDGLMFSNKLIDGSLSVSKTTIGGNTDKDFSFTLNLFDMSGSELNNDYHAKKYLQNHGYEIQPCLQTIYAHTDNINDIGENTGDFTSPGTTLNKQAIVSLPGAESLHVKLWYSNPRGQFYIWDGIPSGINPESTSSPSFNADFNPDTAMKKYPYISGKDHLLLYDEFDVPSGAFSLYYNSYAYYTATEGYNENTNYGYYMEISGIAPGEVEVGYEEMSLSNNETFTLKTGEHIVINGIPDGATYEIIEQEELGWSIISDTGSKGTITAGSESTASFVNAYNAEGSAIITATKHLAGGSIEDYTFNFELLNEDMQQIQFKQNDAQGNVIFDPIYYENTDAGKTFTYYIREVSDPESSVTFDESIYTVNVTVQDNGQGELETTVTYPDGEPVFENSAAFSITVGKTVGGSMGEKNKQFRFELALTGDHIETAQMTYNKEGTTGNVQLTSGKYAFTLAHDETITISGIPAGSTYTVTELDANKNAYLTQVDAGTTGTLSSDVTIGFTNTRDVVVPTGRNAHPVIPVLIFGLGSALGAGYIIQKKRKPQIIPIDYE